MGGGDESERVQLQGLIDLHQRYRFDPAGLAPREREALQMVALNLARELEVGLPVRLHDAGWKQASLFRKTGSILSNAIHMPYHSLVRWA